MDLEIPDNQISLSTLFGDVSQETLELIVDRAIWWGKFYHGIRFDSGWNSLAEVPISQPDILLSPTSDTFNDELVSRVLDIFEGIIFVDCLYFILIFIFEIRCESGGHSL